MERRGWPGSISGLWVICYGKVVAAVKVAGRRPRQRGVWVECATGLRLNHRHPQLRSGGGGDERRVTGCARLGGVPRPGQWCQ